MVNAMYIDGLLSEYDNWTYCARKLKARQSTQMMAQLTHINAR